MAHFDFSDVAAAEGAWQTVIDTDGWGEMILHSTTWEDYSGSSTEHLYSYGGYVGSVTYSCLFHLDIANSLTWDSLVPGCADAGLLNPLRYGPIDYALAKRTYMGQGRAVVRNGYAYMYGGSFVGAPAPTRDGAFGDMWRIRVDGLYDATAENVADFFEWVWVTDVDTRLDTVASFDVAPVTPAGRISCGFAGFGNWMYVHGGIQVISGADVDRTDLWSVLVSNALPANGANRAVGKFMFGWCSLVLAVIVFWW